MEVDRENPLECIICNQTLKQPVLLPCGHTVCKIHEIERKEKNSDIYCCECDESHEIPSKGFPVVRAMEDLLKRKFQNIDLGEEHVKASNAFKELGEFLKKMQQIKQNPELEINEIVWELKNKVDLRREISKKQIDDEAQAIIDELDEFERKCMMNREQIDATKQSSELAKLLDNLEKEFSTWQKELRSFERNEESWRLIKTKCLFELERLKTEYEMFKQKIFDDQLFDLEIKQTKFCLDQNEPLL